MSRRMHWLLVAGALLVGLGARLPGVAWGTNFPGGFVIHHPDESTHIALAELLVDPSKPSRSLHPYPEAMAAHAVPLMVLSNVASGRPMTERPPLVTTVVAGRLVSVAYGVATILLIVLLCGLLFRDRRVGVLAAWILALGGLHVSQSHMFLSDVPGIFWWLLATYLLLLDARPQQQGSEYLRWAAAACGAAFGMKLVVAALPALGLMALARGPRLRRVVHSAVFFGFGFFFINLAAYDLHDLMKTVVRGGSDPYVFDRFRGALLHVIELPRLVGLPVAVLGVLGALALAFRALRIEDRQRRWSLVIIVILPILIHTAMLLKLLDHFPRHLVPYIPWLAIGAGWLVLRGCDRVARAGLHPAVVLVPVLLYQALFVFDGERVFIDEPRNQAARWLETNTEPGSTYWWRWHTERPGRVPVWFPNEGRPDVLVTEMLNENHMLSGVWLRDSHPRDIAGVHDSPTQEVLDAHQALFRGETEYREVARFSEGYFMPEYTLIGRLLGDRSRSYVTEIVIFAKP